jgi:transposase
MLSRWKRTTQDIRHWSNCTNGESRWLRLHRKGYGVMQIVELSGLSYPTVRSAIDQYDEGGLAALKPGTRGKRAGQGRTLTEEQGQAIRKIICDKRPEQLKMKFALWNRGAVMRFIEREYGLKLSVRVSATICHAGASPHRSRSRRPASNDRKPCNPGLVSNTEN